MDLTFLNQTQLARRWSLSPRTLERWRWIRRGPAYVKLEGRVLYRIEDVQDFEERRRRETQSSTPWHRSDS
jgi:hypothetical protein